MPSTPTFDLIEVGGFRAALGGMRFPTKSNHLSDSTFLESSMAKDPGVVIGPKDLDLASRLIRKGNVHGKFQRGITAWFSINMPVYVWSELDTYSVGVDMISSESTMYTLVKECKEVSSSMFVEGTPDYIVEQFKHQVGAWALEFGGQSLIPLRLLKLALPSGWMQKRNRGFSYQCLANMYASRKDHRLVEWRDVICANIEKLPYFKELILGESPVK